MFLGRSRELKELREEFKKDRKGAILVYGKRRVGKSTLLREAAKEYDGALVYHLCLRTTFEGNLALFTRSVAQALALPQLSFNTIFDLFDFLRSLNRKLLVIIDEYQYWKESLKGNELDSFFQSIVDNLSDNIKIVFCGSYISTMKELMSEDNPLFGRFTLIEKVEEFDYYDASLFYPEKDEREKIKLYSIFGGSPYVLSNLDYSKSTEENIRNLLIGQNSILRNYIENVMLREIQKVYDVRILECLANGKKRYSDILSYLNEPNSGLLDKQLKNLINMETISKVSPINRRGDSRKQFYEIKDNLMRFYFSYIFANDSLIAKFGEDTFFNNNILPSLNTFVSYRFENIVLQYFIRLAPLGKLDGAIDFGSYWYDDKRNKKNGQFDVVIRKKNGYDFYECKFYSSPMKLEECEEEEKQVKAMTGMDYENIGFVASAGFDFISERYALIASTELYRLF